MVNLRGLEGSVFISFRFSQYGFKCGLFVSGHLMALHVKRTSSIVSWLPSSHRGSSLNSYVYSNPSVEIDGKDFINPEAIPWFLKSEVTRNICVYRLISFRG